VLRFHRRGEICGAGILPASLFICLSDYSADARVTLTTVRFQFSQ
jgi:hypothetical protein